MILLKWGGGYLLIATNCLGQSTLEKIFTSEMNISLTPYYDGKRFIKIFLEKDEASLMADYLIKINEIPFRLSPTGMFTLSMLEEHRHKQGALEVTYGSGGVRELLEDIDYKPCRFAKPLVAELLIHHLQYFSTSSNNFNSNAPIHL